MSADAFNLDLSNILLLKYFFLTFVDFVKFHNTKDSFRYNSPISITPKVIVRV